MLYGFRLMSTGIGEVGAALALLGIIIVAWGVGALVVGFSTYKPWSWTRFGLMFYALIHGLIGSFLVVELFHEMRAPFRWGEMREDRVRWIAASVVAAFIIVGAGWVTSLARPRRIPGMAPDGEQTWHRPRVVLALAVVYWVSPLLVFWILGSLW